MSEMGRASTITGVLDKSIEPGALRPVNKRGFKYYCPNCYSFNLWYVEIETDVYDLTCIDCNKHWRKKRKK